MEGVLMSDVFLSYDSQDRDRILPIVKALEADGLSVWWDRDIQAGVAYDRAIEAAIAAAGCVVVVWSEHSIESEYVRSEVEDAASRNILVPVLIDDVQPPLAHRRRQSATLVGWKNKPDDEFQKLTAGIRAKIDAPAASEDGIEPATRTIKNRWYATAGLVLIVLLSVSYYYRESVLVAIAMNVPVLFFGEAIEQQLGFATAADGTRIAYATSGNGPPIMHVLSINTDLMSGQHSPIYDNDGLVAMSSRHNLFVRYDGRGMGLSDRDVDDFSLSARVSDLSAVADAAGLERFGILAVSAGGPAAITYTARHPERVSRLVLAGTVVSNDHINSQARAAWEKFLDFLEVSWQIPAVTIRQAELLIGPDGDAVDKRIMGEMMRRAMDGPAIAGFHRATLQIDVSEEAQRISVPTLVLHSPDDPLVPLVAGRKVASLIPGAIFELVDGGHMASSASTAATRRRALEFLASGQ